MEVCLIASKKAGNASEQKGKEKNKWSSPKQLPDWIATNYDRKLLIDLIVICCFGLIMIYSSSAYVSQTKTAFHNSEYYLVMRELLFMLVGFAAMLVISKLDYHLLQKLTIPLYVVSIIMMLLVNFTSLGVEVNGQKRWLRVLLFKGPTYQPAEFVKIAVILVFAAVINFCIKNIDKFSIVLILLVLLFVPFLLVAKNNLSSGLIIFGIGALMYIMASRGKKRFWVPIAVLVIAAIIVYFYPEILAKVGILKSYQMNRIYMWKNPELDPNDKGYQILQGLYAIGSGGFFGKGLGNSTQKLKYIPEAHNDMIFAIICEELGIFGACCVMFLFAYLIYRCVYIIVRARDLYGALLVIGVMMQIGLQVLLNIAVVTNCVPNTGISLPFISYGGTSVSILLAEMGIVLSVSNQIYYEK